MEGLKAPSPVVARVDGARGYPEADIEAGQALLASGTIPVADIAKRLGVSRSTFYAYFPQARGKGAGRRR